MRLIGRMVALLTLSATLAWCVPTAMADSDTATSLTKTSDSLEVSATKKITKKGSGSKHSAGSRASEAPRYVHRRVYEREKARYVARMQRYIAARTAAAACVGSGRPCANVPTPADFNLSPIDADGVADLPVGASLPPQVVAYAAIAQLRLDAPKPVIGPPPSINPWKIAAVGYPLWFSVDADLDPAPVTTTVYDLTVSLDARLDKVVFNPGDGTTLTCTDLTRPWTRAVTPGTPSPVCGHRYTKPSLPKGPYTITANAIWTVTWRVNGTTGTIPIYQTASTTLPVGELQVLTR